MTETSTVGKNYMLRFEFKGKQYDVASLTSTDTVGDLRAVVCSMLSIDDYSRINLKTLRPTRIIDITEDSKCLATVLSQTRERIIVEDVRTEPLNFAHHSSATHNTDTTRQQQYDHQQARPSPIGVKHRKSDSQDAVGVSDLVEPNLALRNDYSSFLNADQGAESIENARHSDSPARQRKLPREHNDFPVCSSTGYLLRHPVPSNNSCLFISVHFCLTNGEVDDQIGKSMRKIIADTVASDKERFDDAFLGKSNADYCRWILDDNNWGGAIELSILCKYYETEIVAVDVKNIVLNRFGQDSNYPQRMLLLYDGIHYDPLKFQPLDDNQPIQTLFSTENMELLTLAEELAKEAKQSHQFTDMNSIKMKCTVCKAEFDSKNAALHASQTGHVDFVESHQSP